MKYSIEPIFIIFPAICLLVGILNKRRNPIVDWLLGAGFIVFYSFSLNGADLENYNILYNLMARGVPISKIHGETGFNLIMQFFAKSGVDYLVFRISLLVITTVVLFLCMRKFSGNFALSLYLLSSMFLIYTISSYRQYITMVFSILWMIVYEKGYKKTAIIGTALLMLFHIIAFVPLCFLLIYHAMSEQSRKAAARFLCRNFLFLLFFTMLLRLFVYLVLKTGILTELLRAFIGNYANISPSLLSAGLISRIAFWTLITYMYSLKKSENNLQRMLFLFYSVGMLLYVIVPLELVMGRLMNNANILLVILVPCLIFEPFAEGYPAELTETKKKSIRLAALGLVLVAFAVLLSQLTKQGGYFPYGNILFQLIAE